MLVPHGQAAAIWTHRAGVVRLGQVPSRCAERCGGDGIVKNVYYCLFESVGGGEIIGRLEAVSGAGEFSL